MLSRRSLVWSCNISQLNCSPSSKEGFGATGATLERVFLVWESELNCPIADAAPSLSRKRQFLLLSCQLNKDGLPTFHTVLGLGETTRTRRRSVLSFT